MIYNDIYIYDVKLCKMIYNDIICIYIYTYIYHDCR